MNYFREYGKARKAAIEEWETLNNKNLENTLNDISSIIICTIRDFPDHFSKDFERLNKLQNTKYDVIKTIHFSIIYFIEKTTQSGKSWSDKQKESWERTLSILGQMRDLYRRIPETRRDIINAHLELRGVDLLPDNLGASLMAARTIMRRGEKSETRGRKTLPISVLVVQLTEGVEEAFDRNLTRSFDIVSHKKAGRIVEEFTNPDCVLIHNLCRAVINDVTARQVKSAMKNHLTKLQPSLK